jgi:hypothetical protein
VKPPPAAHCDGVKDLLTARRLLGGEEVRGGWKTATIRLDASAREAVENTLGAAMWRQS